MLPKENGKKCENEIAQKGGFHCLWSQRQRYNQKNREREMTIYTCIIVKIKLTKSEADNNSTYE